MEGARFPDTQWSVVVLAAADGQPQAQHALGALCHSYWFPLFALLRARGHSREEAEDLLQGFFLHLFEKQPLSRADRLKGSFRGFLIGCLKFYLANERDRATAQRRGGHARVLSLDVAAAESWLATEPDRDPAADAEREFDRRWARLVMERALAQLQASYARPEVYAVLKAYLTTDAAGDYAAAAERLDMTPGAVKVAVHRMRSQFRRLLRLEIAGTVSAPHEIDDEIRHLLRTLLAE